MIALGSDHAGLELKNDISVFLEQKSQGFHDYGSYTDAPCDYADYAVCACEAVTDKKADMAILISADGAGMSMAANKIRGIRAVCCSDCFTARRARRCDDANVLCLGARVVGSGLAREIVCAFLSSEFENSERHLGRVAKLNELDNHR